ncbi:hypothetical protein [Ferruginibacter albus]|uniref:hypothetical protein n=1 Tax=Ferruginibacter albus TaxID=2875540 RepID=UPI001CC77883|nr:hypothetical protein [Ferruginibacter albus]UAY52905.1 hypothetical protein K9M53_04305 [Ferruginibacter albus]
MNQVKNILFGFFMASFLWSCSGKSAKENTQKENNDTTAVRNISSSNSMDTLLSQHWAYKEDYDDYDNSNGLDIPYRGYCFFLDGTAVKDPHEEMELGKWNLSADKTSIEIKYDKGNQETFKIYDIRGKALVLTNADKKKIEMVGDGVQEVNVKDDPYAISNNNWRIKPTQKETPEQIRQRLKGCVRFFDLYYKDNVARNKLTILFRGLPSCFNWYQGGITLQNEDVLDEKWIDCFYNKEQAMDAYKMADKVISKKYNWDKEEKNWVKQSAGVLDQMYVKLDSL